MVGRSKEAQGLPTQPPVRVLVLSRSRGTWTKKGQHLQGYRGQRAGGRQHRGECWERKVPKRVPPPSASWRELPAWGLGTSSAFPRDAPAPAEGPSLPSPPGGPAAVCPRRAGRQRGLRLGQGPGGRFRKQGLTSAGGSGGSAGSCVTTPTSGHSDPQRLSRFRIRATRVAQLIPDLARLKTEGPRSGELSPRPSGATSHLLLHTGERGDVLVLDRRKTRGPEESPSTRQRPGDAWTKPHLRSSHQT